MYKGGGFGTPVNPISEQPIVKPKEKEGVNIIDAVNKNIDKVEDVVIKKIDQMEEDVEKKMEGSEEDNSGSEEEYEEYYSEEELDDLPIEFHKKMEEFRRKQLDEDMKEDTNDGGHDSVEKEEEEGLPLISPIAPPTTPKKIIDPKEYEELTAIAEHMASAEEVYQKKLDGVVNIKGNGSIEQIIEYQDLRDKARTRREEIEAVLNDSIPGFYTPENSEGENSDEDDTDSSIKITDDPLFSPQINNENLKQREDDTYTVTPIQPNQIIPKAPNTVIKNSSISNETESFDAQDLKDLGFKETRSVLNQTESFDAKDLKDLGFKETRSVLNETLSYDAQDHKDLGFTADDFHVTMDDLDAHIDDYDPLNLSVENLKNASLSHIKQMQKESSEIQDANLTGEIHLQHHEIPNYTEEELFSQMEDLRYRAGRKAEIRHTEKATKAVDTWTRMMTTPRIELSEFPYQGPIAHPMLQVDLMKKSNLPSPMQLVPRKDVAEILRDIYKLELTTSLENHEQAQKMRKEWGLQNHKKYPLAHFIAPDVSFLKKAANKNTPIDPVQRMRVNEEILISERNNEFSQALKYRKKFHITEKMLPITGVYTEFGTVTGLNSFLDVYVKDVREIRPLEAKTPEKQRRPRSVERGYMKATSPDRDYTKRMQRTPPQTRAKAMKVKKVGGRRVGEKRAPTPAPKKTPPKSSPKKK